MSARMNLEQLGNQLGESRRGWGRLLASVKPPRSPTSASTQPYSTPRTGYGHIAHILSSQHLLYFFLLSSLRIASNRIAAAHPHTRTSSSSSRYRSAHRIASHRIASQHSHHDLRIICKLLPSLLFLRTCFLPSSSFFASRTSPCTPVRPESGLGAAD